MNKTIKKWVLRIFLFALVSFLTIVISVFNPQFLYANKTEVGNYSVYHNSVLASNIEARLAAVNAIVRQSELYDPSYKINLCLNDGSYYPTLMETLRGPAFGWGFHNIATFRGTFDYQKNTVEYRGYKWNMEQLIAHEITHCMQANVFGLLNGNPVANHPTWKWEGYAEYTARKNKNQLSLAKNIEHIAMARKENSDAWGVFFNDGTVAPRVLYDAWLLIQYCLDIKGMTYIELLNSKTPKASLEQEMNEWYQHQLEKKN